MTSKEFSVLMSVYGKDNPKFFLQALRSVSTQQSLKPNQIVVVYDGPVPEDIRKYFALCSRENPGIEFTEIPKEQNAGLAAALNTGLQACKYRLVARMDSDDIARPDRFEKQLAFLKEHPQVSILSGAIAEFENIPGDIDSIRSVGLSEKEILGMAKSRTPFNHVAVVFDKSAVTSVGGYCENFGKLEDYKLWVDMLSAGYQPANLSDVLVDVRVGNGFIERRSNRREIEDWDNLQKYLLKAGFISRFQALLNRICIRIFIYTPSALKRFIYKHILRK